MSIHIGAKQGEIAEAVLLPGDPLRARYVAETFLTDPHCYSSVRGMLGFTGEYKSKQVSVQGTGMGIPSISIYVNELIAEYGVKVLLRTGTCGGIQPELDLGDVILAQAACTDSAVNRIRFQGSDFAPCADFGLLNRAYQIAQTPVSVGPVLTSDTFYQDDPDFWKIWARYEVIAVEMETTALYTAAAGHRARSLSLLTVSDSLVSGESASHEQRQQGYTDMIEIALQLAAE